MMEDRLAEIRARTSVANAVEIQFDSDDDRNGRPYLIVDVTPETDAAVDTTRDFILHARDDVPWLLDEIERLKGEIATLKGKEND